LRRAKKLIVDHIAIKVSNLKEAEEWYINHLNGTVTFRDPKYIRISIENTNIALIDEKHYDHAHIGILINNYEDLPLNKGEVVKHRDGTVGVYVKDPFGNYLEYIWYSNELRKVFVDD
jgi:extradiol dioxygenase family protein